MNDTRTDFFQKLDDMIVAGAPVMQVVRALNIRERTVRRRKGELGRAGRLTSNLLQGLVPGAKNANTVNG
jgi:FixJ family two-component response regulator